MGNGRHFRHHVYLIRRPDGLIKVGISLDPHRRLSDFATGSPETLSILKVVKVLDELNARRIERAVKVSLLRYRIRGEWFKCSNERALRALRDAAFTFNSAVRQPERRGPQPKRWTMPWLIEVTPN